MEVLGAEKAARQKHEFSLNHEVRKHVAAAVEIQLLPVGALKQFLRDLP